MTERFALVGKGTPDAPSDGKTYARKDAAWIAIVTTDVVTITGGTLSTAERAGSIAIKDLKFDQDGNVYEKSTPGSYTQVEASTDWVVPETDALAFQVRYTNPSGSVTSSGTEDVWHLLSAGDFVMTVADNSPGDGTTDGTFTIEVRLFNGGAVLDAGTYTLKADRTS